MRYALLGWALAVQQLGVSALATGASQSMLDDIGDEQSMYLSYSHAPRLGHAYLGAGDPSALADPISFDWSNVDLDQATNPAPAYLRHPLAVPQGASLQHQPVRRDVITKSDAPYPPGSYIDVNNLTTIAILAQATVARMQTWYEDGLYEWTAWWQTPVLGMAYAGLDLALGNSGNELLVKDVLIKNDGLGWMIDKYIDDQSWWAMFALRAYQNYGNETWLSMVETINNNNTLYWDDTCGGGVLWLTYRPKIKNTITNGLYFSILARLYRFTGNQTHLDYATNTLNWWLDWGFEASTGRVYDTITAPDCNTTGLQTWTYNSGAFLYGLADMYYATGNTTLLDLGRTIAYAAIRDFSNLDTGVLTESCEDDPQPSATLPPGCQQDEVVFKGILVMGMAELYVARPDPNIYNFINTQLLAVTFNNVDPTFLFGEWWGGPWNETTAGPKTQINALCLLSAAAMVNQKFLSSVGADTKVSGQWGSDQVAVPSNSTFTATGQAGTTQRADSATSAAAALRRGEGGAMLAGLSLLLLVGGVVLVW